MSWFNRKKEPEKPIVIQEKTKECNHKYIDFDWYMKTEYNESTNDYSIEVYEPYVCIFCKNRRDELLDYSYGRGYERKDYEDAKREFEALYPKIKPMAIVEDQIKDMQLVDKYTLDAYFTLHPELDNRKDK